MASVKEEFCPLHPVGLSVDQRDVCQEARLLEKSASFCFLRIISSLLLTLGPVPQHCYTTRGCIYQTGATVGAVTSHRLTQIGIDVVH